MGPIRRLTPCEGVLYALYLADGEVFGITRLNKLLARLQRDGFPITNQFFNAKMGPYDPEIDSYTAQLSDDGLITKTTSASEYYENDRQDFFLTPSGHQYIESEIVPLINVDPFYGHFMEFYLNHVKDNYKKWAIPHLVNVTHEELFISPDNSKFLAESFKTRESLIQRFNDIERSYRDFCYIDLVLLGSLEFPIRCLERILAGDINDRATGKNNILVKSKCLLDNIDGFLPRFNLRCEPCIRDLECKDGTNCLSKSLYDIKYYLHCIESNAGYYNILEPFNDDWDLVDYMTAQEESLFASHFPIKTTMA